MDRRQFLAGAAAVGATTTLFPATVRAQTVNRVRRSVMTMKADDPFFRDYAKAVTAMHQLPATDQRNWRNQALIHLNYCPHAAEDFVHWHRYYLTYFEEICGQLSGNPNFALAYWDWSADSGIIPDPFYDVDALNVAYWKDKSDAQSPNWGPDEVTTIGIRILPKGTGVQSDKVRGGAFTKEKLQEILASTDFASSFWPSLEQGPHNNGHVVVGGSRGHMGDGMSPLDPIFWLHHTMVDYMWASWQAKGNVTPGLDKNYSGQFVNAQGQPVTGITSAGTLNYPALGYTYEGLPTPPSLVAMAAAPKRAARTAAPIASSNDSKVVSAPYVTNIPLTGARNQARTLSATAPNGGRVLAEITVGNAPVAAPLLINVFVNKPDANAQTPYTDPAFAGSFSFFGGHRLHAMPQNIVIDMSKALSRVAATNPSDISLQLVPVMLEPITGTPPTFTVRSVRVVRS